MAYASTEGQLDSFDANGNPLFVSETEYNRILVNESQNGLNDMYEMVSKIVGEIWDLDLSYDFSVACMQMLYSQHSDIDDSIQSKFTFYDPFGAKKIINLLKERA